MYHTGIQEYGEIYITSRHVLKSRAMCYRMSGMGIVHTIMKYTLHKTLKVKRHDNNNIETVLFIAIL